MTTLPALKQFVTLVRRSVPWVRTGLLGVGLAMVSAIVVMISGERAYHVHAALQVRAEQDVEAAARAHLGALLSPRTLGAAEDTSPGVRAIVESDLSVRTEIEPAMATLHLEAVTHDGDRTRRLIDALGSTYLKLHAVTSRPASRTPRVVTGLSHRRTELNTRAASIAAEIKRLAPLCAGFTLDERRRLTAELESRRTAWREAANRHAATAAALNTLLAEQTPTGTVDPVRREQAERQDSTLQRDVNALLDRVEVAHGELVRVTAGVKPAVIALLGVLKVLDTRLSEHREDQSSLEVAAVLERLSLAVTDYQAAANAFRAAWDAEASALSKPGSAAQAEKLLAQQVELERMVRDFGLETEPFEAALKAQLETLADEGEERTRRIVIQNALRGPVSAVGDAAVRLGEAGRAALTPDNFRLDAACRSAIGLARRIEERRTEIEARLQVETNEHAAREHLAAIEETRKSLADRTEKRDRALEAVTKTVQQILELDPAYAVVVESRAQREAARREAAALDAERRRLEEVIALPWPGGSAPETLTFVPAVAEPLPPPAGRLGRSLAAFAGTVIVVLACAVALTVKRPIPR